MIPLLILALAATLGLASQNFFNVQDDIFAFPQYEVNFPQSYVLRDVALAKLKAQSDSTSTTPDLVPLQSEDTPEQDLDLNVEYEHMVLHGRSYLCSIPQVELSQENKTEEFKPLTSETDLAQAADRGWQLLQDMAGKPCLYYSTGWWSYSFCYNGEVKQFHALSQTGARTWPPQEDPGTPNYVLGRFDQNSKVPPSTVKDEGNTDVAQLQSKAETNYMVQRLDGGTPCDLTGKDRKIEVQFHCHPQSTDRIGWIKETATCAYLMVVYTPRLCNDVAFMPPKESETYSINCEEILNDEEDEISEWEAYQESQSQQTISQEPTNQRLVVGNIEIGAMKHVGRDGKKIEKSRVLMTADEKAEIVIMQKDGKVETLSKAKLKEMNLRPEDIEDLKKQVQQIAGGKDWKIERIDELNGKVQLRGIVDGDDDEEEGDETETKEQKKAENTEEAEGSEEEYKEEV